jgi:hypothetical protein
MKSIGSYLCVVGLLLLIVVAAQAGCAALASTDKAAQLLQRSGYSDIHLESKSGVLVQVRGCSDTDVVLYKFSASNPRDEPVQVQVCQGWPFKGATIRG